MNCKECRKNLPAHIERLLSVEASRELEAHLSICAACESENNSLVELHRQLLADGQTFSGKSMSCTVMERIQSVDATDSEKRTPFALRKLVAAGAVLATTITLLAMLLFTNGAGMTLAEVREAVNAQPWLHIKYDNGREWWVSLKERKSFFKDEDGRVVYLDSTKNLRWVHRKGSGYISEDAPRIYAEGQRPDLKPLTAWEYVVGHYEKLAESPRHHFRAEKHKDEIDGKVLVRFDMYFEAATEKEILVRQLWVDPETRLPIRIQERLDLAHREEQKRDWITGTYDFPKDGPSDIFDLGVPRDLEVVRTELDVLDAGVKDVLDKAVEAWKRWPATWRLVTWSETDTQMTVTQMTVIYWSGKPRWRKHGMPDYAGVKMRQESYSVLSGPPKSAEEVLDRTRMQNPRHVYLSDGEKAYRKSSNGDDVRLRVHRADGVGIFNSAHWPRSYQWPVVNRMGPFQIVGDSEERVPGTIMIRGEAGDVRNDYVLDPDRDHICRKWIRWRKRSGQWEREWEENLSDFDRLLDGQWYAKRRNSKRYANPERGTDGSATTCQVEVKTLEKNDISAGVFDGQKLLEEAKQQGASITSY